MSMVMPVFRTTISLLQDVLMEKGDRLDFSISYTVRNSARVG
jgi:hypothetical protein